MLALRVAAEGEVDRARRVLEDLGQRREAHLHHARALTQARVQARVQASMQASTQASMHACVHVHACMCMRVHVLHLDALQRALADALPPVVGDVEVPPVALQHEGPLLGVGRRLRQPVGPSRPLRTIGGRSPRPGVGVGVGVRVRVLERPA